ncbi:MAG: DUF4360 domain-containing protein [Bauldia sp.]|nr:DUF4360 domain-containing protein [Bauldia sp.]
MKHLALAAFALVAASAAANAQTFGEPTLGGTACRAGTAASITGGVLNPTIVIDGFVAETTPAGMMARATCTIAVPVDVPEGRSIAVVGAGYRLDASIAGGTTAAVSLEAFLAGQQAPPLTRVIDGPRSGAFVGAAVVSAADRQWSACGADVIVRMNASVLLTAERAAPSTVTVGQLRIKLASRAC